METAQIAHEAAGGDSMFDQETLQAQRETPLPALPTNGLYSGSIILIDPTTSGIIGTLTPASPGSDTTGSGSDLQPLSSPSSPDHISLGADIDGSSRAELVTPKRRDPTYSYRLSISDLSLRTFNAPPGSDTSDSDSGTISPSVIAEVDTGGKGDGGDQAKGVKSSRRSSWMTDDASFWTARGTLRMDGPVPTGGDEGQREREVIVAYVKTDTPLTDLFPPYIPTPHKPKLPNSARPPPLDLSSSTLRTIDSRLTAQTSGTDSPFPSRILHLFPRLSTLPRNRTPGISGSGLPGGMTQGLSWPSMESMDPGTIMAAAGSHAEAAFWRLVMPGISGIYGWTAMLGQAYEQVAAYIPIPLLSSNTNSDPAPLLIDSSIPESARESRLYSEETIYTLRLPASAEQGEDVLDLGPTARPMWVRKRAALPVFDDREDAWSRDGDLRQMHT